MLTVIFIIAIISNAIALETFCTNCKYYIPNNRGNNDLGLCKMFINKCYHRGKEYNLPNYAIHCRNNENLCGKTGNLYEPINVNLDKNKINIDLQNDLNILNEINNRCCGEVNETDEIEQFEKDFFEIFQKIKKHNKKNFYGSTKDLYNLFRRN